ncbi:MAG: apolipoprotein N-acyltransferase [Phycisphaerae bacterium]|nr:apolipoprotein N-acyltransferase [Phycisphaerae bacterium]
MLSYLKNRYKIMSIGQIIKSDVDITGWPALLTILIAGLLTGYLMRLCFYPYYFHYLAWIGFVPVILVLPRLRPDNAAILGVVLAMSYYCFCLNWLFSITAIISLSLFFLWSLVLAVAFYCVSTLMRKYGIGWLLLLMPVAIVGQELIRAETLTRIRFAYAAIGYSQSANLFIAQIASIGGVYFISFLIILVNAAIALVIIKRQLQHLVVLVGLIICIGVLALYSQSTISENQPGDNLIAAAIQIDSVNKELLIDTITKTIEANVGVDFIVMPEHLFSDRIGLDDPFINKVQALATKHEVCICLGVHVDPENPGVCDYDNTALLIHPDGKIDSQAKAVPLPFFMDGNPASRQEVFKTAHGNVGVFICYDGSFTDIPRQLVDKGAEFLLAPVMNPMAWPTAQRFQQIDIARFRAIELRRYMVRSSNSGISAIVNPNGKLLGNLPVQEQNVAAVAKIMPNNDRTIFVSFGYHFNSLLKILMAILIFYSLYIDLHRKK